MVMLCYVGLLMMNLWVPNPAWAPKKNDAELLFLNASLASSARKPRQFGKWKNFQVPGDVLIIIFFGVPLSS